MFGLKFRKRLSTVLSSVYDMQTDLEEIQQQNADLVAKNEVKLATLRQANEELAEESVAAHKLNAKLADFLS